ncbi:MAG: hypothetical protein DLD55_05670 [candidate division SR1 bacterium]|nr:MAG: hypothetical protein DLD55_05670 [candidate division SR1 bacterium]
MKLLLTSYPNDGRKLRQFLTALLKKKLIISAKVMNYAKSYTLVEGKIQKEEEKLIFIKFSKEKESEVLNFIKKLHPYEIPQLIILNAQFVDENYLKDC